MLQKEMTAIYGTLLYMHLVSGEVREYIQRSRESVWTVTLHLS